MKRVGLGLCVGVIGDQIFHTQVATWVLVGATLLAVLLLVLIDEEHNGT